jgi:23S rRNA pseudouridine2605 synthase
MKQLKRTGKNYTKISAPPKGVRINKYIADAGICSRRKAEDYVLQGKVKINGKTVLDLATLINPGDRVLIDGNQIKETTRHTYIILNKPKDCITTTSDDMGRMSVTDIVRTRARVFPVGRLDRNTTGILLLTNDGELAQKLSHPKYQVERIYNAGLDKPLKLEHAKQLANGIIIEGEMTGKCEIFINPDDKSKVTLKLHEGKNREIRNMFEYFGYFVKKLDRKYFATLSTKGLARGEYRHLDKKELLDLKKYLNMA